MVVWVAGGFLALTLLGCLHTAGAFLCLALYHRRPEALLSAAPSVTILKPLHGAEPRLFDNLASTIRQDYPGPVQVVFGVGDPRDAALLVVQELEAAFPDADLTPVVDPRRHGRNGKISNLINMARAMTGEVVILADSDMLVEPDYVTRVVAALQQPGVGGVTCLYRGVSLPGVWSRSIRPWITLAR